MLLLVGAGGCCGAAELAAAAGCAISLEKNPSPHPLLHQPPYHPPPPVQVNFLGYEHNPDLMLLAARALTFLADVFPPAAASIIRHGAVPAFCARLLTIEYIDLAEQSLQVRPAACRW